MLLQVVIYSFSHCIVGSGPAGTALLGALLDKGFEDVYWIAKDFNGGMLQKYKHVPGNAPATAYRNYMESSESVERVDSKGVRRMKTFKAQEEPTLEYAHGVVQDVSRRLRSMVKSSEEGYVEKIQIKNGEFKLSVKASNRRWNPRSSTIKCKKLYLAIGSVPREVNIADYGENAVSIGMDDGLDRDILSSLIDDNDKVCVVGNSHTGVLVLRNLHALNVDPENVYMVYKERHPEVYGQAKVFQDEHLDKDYKINWMPLADITPETSPCTKVVSAIGLDRVVINIDYNNKRYTTMDLKQAPHSNSVTLNKQKIKGLYALGIAFPRRDENGVTRVGLKPFSEAAVDIANEVDNDLNNDLVGGY
jgi:thioredoxin reductase